MNYVNKFLRNIKPYKSASHKIWTVNPHERSAILKLDWNEATISPSPAVKDALVELLRQPEFFNLYPATCNHDLLNALSEYTRLPKNNIQYFASSDYLHEYIAKLYISPGDPVLILWPSYDNFRLTAETNGARLHYSELDDNFAFNPDKFQSDIDNYRPSLIYICNPNNPTGTFIEPAMLEKLFASNPESMFVIDEAYIEFAGQGVNDLVLKYSNILVTHTMSKAFALANFRFGYLVSCAGNISDVNNIRNSKNVTTFTQTAATAALSDVEYMNAYVEQVRKSEIYFVDAINNEFADKLFAYHSRGNFVLVKCRIPDLKLKVLTGLEERNIFVRNISLDDCIRITLGTREQMCEVINALRNII